MAEYISDEGIDADSAYVNIKNTITGVANQIVQATGNNPILNNLKPENIVNITRDYLDDQPIGWSSPDLFQQSFAQMFLSYFETYKLNKLKRLDLDSGIHHTKVLSDEEFIDKHGEPPWEFVNSVLSDAGIGFEISYPQGYTITNFTPKLTKISSGAEIQFSQLSSGEKILMSFAFCLYYSKDRRHSVQKPKILLLDEIDATLHPSMSRQLIKTITESLVSAQGVHVIMTTHSPSTVAVAPEDSVYLMKGDTPGLHKVSKRQAVSVLTAEIPTLAISFDGRRQVFVESHTDAERFELLYRNLLPYLDSERSLVFIGVGRRKSDGTEVGSGCAQVKSIVQSLRDGGNDSVYGLLDWDRRNEPEDRVHILGKDNRYAIENCLLDPLLIVSLLIREGRGNNKFAGLGEEVRYRDIDSLGVELLQNAVDEIQNNVLGEVGTEKISVSYLGNFELLISKKYLYMQGHSLENMVIESFPCLKRFGNNGKLLRHIIDSVLVDLPHFLPMDILECFMKLLNDGGE
ncbi:ATP-dependent nuclease [Pseudoalteromonas xiamenensis]